MEIINNSERVSKPFVIGKGEQYTLFASGLQGDDEVVIEIITMTPSGPIGDYCCPGPVALPEIVGATPLVCRNGVEVKMTADMPWVTLSSPQSVPLRARVVTDDDTAVISVTKNATAAEDCMACVCEEAIPIDASVHLPGGGFMFHPGDKKDKRATVRIESCGGELLGWLFPAAGPGHTTKVQACDGTVIGWAMNRSETASETNPYENAVCAMAATDSATAQILSSIAASLQTLAINTTGITQISTAVQAIATSTAQLAEAAAKNDTLNPGICPSLRLPGGGYIYSEGDAVDPAASIMLTTCANTLVGYAYPSAGPGHTVRIETCDGAIIGYAANRSACAPECSLCDVAEATNINCDCSQSSSGAQPTGRDAAATVELQTCTGETIGYAYPN